jgi:hypothetical protein
MIKSIKVRVSKDEICRALNHAAIEASVELPIALLKQDSFILQGEPVEEPATAVEVKCKHGNEACFCGPCHRSEAEKGEPLPLVHPDCPGCCCLAPKELSDQDLDKAIARLPKELPVPEPLGKIEMSKCIDGGPWLLNKRGMNQMRDKLNELIKYLRQTKQ